LVALSTKLLVPALQSICYHFLLSHASGKPIVALALAEEYSHADLYREASRFVLDQRKLFVLVRIQTELTDSIVG
jgi:hypothetical protein